MSEINFNNVLIQTSLVFQVGECFHSFDELCDRMEALKKESFVHYWRRDSRTVQGASMKTSRPIAQQLKYYSIRYACIFGGQQFHSRGNGRRATQSIRSNCPAYVSFLASKCGQKLEVISVCNEHNHEVSAEHMKLMPQNRKLDIHVKKEVLEMLQLNIDKKLVLEYIQLKSNKNFTLKDLFNLSGSIKNKKVPSDDATGYLEMVKKIHNFISENSKTTEDVVESNRKRFKSIEKSQKLISLNETETVYFEMAGDSFVEYILPPESENKNIESLEVTDTVEEPVTYYNPIIENLVHYEVHEIVTRDEFCVENNFDEENIENQELFEIDPNYSNSPNNNGYIEEEIEDEVEENEEYTDQEIKIENFVENNETNDTQWVEDDSSEYENIEPSPILVKTIKYRNKRLGRKIRNCRSCGTSSRLLKMQLEVMKAEKRKIKEETNILKLKKQKLLFELANLKQC